VIDMLMDILKKTILIVLLIIVGIIFFLIQLYKMSINSELDIFSVKNIVVTGLFFILGVPLILFIQRLIKKNDTKDKK